MGLSKLFKKTTDSFLKNIAWIFVVIGGVFIYLSTLFKDPYFGLFEKIGLTILSSGVFATVLKSFQFIGVFKEEIENVILKSEFLEKRSDLPELWKKISKKIYNQKFPEINESLLDIVLKSYFPTNHTYYYEDFSVTINVEELTSDHIIKFTQTYKAKVVMADGQNEATLNHNYRINLFPDIEKQHNNEKLYYKVDGINVLEKTPDPVITEDHKVFSYSTVVKDKKSFTIESKEQRQYCIKHNNYKVFHVNRITKEMDVSISYPDNVNVLFFGLGVVEPFEKKHVGLQNIMTRVHKNSLILPGQGFGLTFAHK